MEILDFVYGYPSIKFGYHKNQDAIWITVIRIIDIQIKFEIAKISKYSFKFIWIISGLHVNNKRINNNIHTKIVMALTSCDNTVITYRWKKREQTHHIESYQTHCRVPIVVTLYFC